MKPITDVLVIDDVSDIGDALVDYLETIDLYAVHVLNGRAAQRWLGGHPQPRLILCDFDMPGMNGAQFVTWLQASPFAEVPVVILSGHDVQVQGAKRVLRKPFDNGELRAAVEEEILPIVPLS